MNRLSLKNGLTALLPILLVVAFAACASNEPAPPVQAGDNDEQANELARLDDEWSAAAATRDVNRIASFYAEDGIAYPPNEPIAVSREAAKKVWAAYFAEPTFKISWKTTRAAVAASSDFGFTSGTYEASYKGADGKLVTEKGKYLCTWKKDADGNWKASHDMWNADAK